MSLYPNTNRVEEKLSLILRTGLFISIGIVLLGLVIFLFRHGTEMIDYRVFKGEPAQYNTVISIIKNACDSHGYCVMQLGALIMILTPIIRVGFCLLVFFYQREYIYILIAVTVFFMLLYSFFGLN